MTKFTKLFIKNFQKHKKYALRLGQITTLVGRSDAGKTAIFRALIWLLTNKPRGTTFITHGETVCSVGLEVDGHKIVRTRGKNKNEYTLDGTPFVSFGEQVPHPIAELLNVQPVSIQRQHDGVFWLSLNPAELSRQMNAVVDLDIIDTATKNSKRHRNQAKSREKFETERFKHWEEQVESLRGVPVLLDKAKTAHNKQTQINEINRQTTNLRTSIAAYQHYYQKLQVLSEIATVASDAEVILNEYFSIEDNIKELTYFVKGYPQYDLKKSKDKLTETQSCFEEVTNLLIHIKQLNSIITNVHSTEDVLWRKKELVRKQKSILEKTLDLTVCETCGQTLPSEKQ